MSSRVPIVDLKAQFATIRAEVRAAIDRVIESQEFILGPEVEALESEIAGYCGTRFAVGVSSGTDALLASLMALGIGLGDEVVTTPYTFVATASSIVRLGARPVFADIDPATFTIDPAAIERKITHRTKAIVPVHLFGQMADMQAIMTIANRHAIPVVEDAAQSIGAARDGHRAGSVGVAGCLSFFPSKNLGAYGDAGMVLTNDEALAARLRLLRIHGQASKHSAALLGGNFRLDAVQAAVLRVKLRHLESWTEARRALAARYRELLAGTLRDLADDRFRPDASIVLPYAVPGARHVYNQFVLRADRRDELRAFVAEQGIACEVYYPQPLHFQPCFASSVTDGGLVQAEQAAKAALALPMYAELTLPMMETVVSAVARFFRGDH